MKWDRSFYIQAKVEEFDSTSSERMKVTLKGVFHNLYYYIETKSQNIYGWPAAQVPKGGIWSIEFLDKTHVAFSQDDFILCAVDGTAGERREVRGQNKAEFTSENSECQWLLGQCPL